MTEISTNIEPRIKSRLDPARLGGWAFQAGNFTLLALGGFRGSLSELSAGAAWITAAEMLRRRGDDPKWFARACGLSIVAMGLTNYEALKKVQLDDLGNLHSAATATLIGTALFGVGYGFFGVFSRPLAQAFKDAKNIAVRWTVGHPRLLMGMLATGSMVPMISDAVSTRDMGKASVLTLFLVGEVLCAASSPDTPPPVADPQNTPSVPLEQDWAGKRQNLSISVKKSSV